MRRDALLLTEILGSIGRDPRSLPPRHGQRSRRHRTDAYSLLWNFTVLGEAANQVSAELKSRSPQLPWADASRTRNRIVHGYWSVDVQVLAAIARDDLPSFLVGVRSLLESMGDED